MKKHRALFCLAVSTLLISCRHFNTTQRSTTFAAKAGASKGSTMKSTKTDTFFTHLFKKYPEFFDTAVQHSEDWNVQVIYTQIDRDANNVSHFTDYYYHVDPESYFYPASTVKMPVAALALQRLQELKSTGITKYTTMLTDSAYSGQTPVYSDSSAPGGKPTVAQYVKKIFLASDNDAFNRLYEFLGQEYINENLHKKGYASAQVLHRLDIFLTEDENRHTNPVKFLADDGSILYRQPPAYNRSQYSLRNDFLGTAHYRDSALIREPMNFSKKNRITLEDLHYILRSLIFPNSVPPGQRFAITDEDYRFLYQYMSQFPSETIFPHYDAAEYPDAYVKFLMHGNYKGSLPKNIRIFNKVGDAYGQMLDIAYIIDLDKKIEFFLSAAINCNTDGIVNDDAYDYDAVGFPFMKNLGNVIYELESGRKRAYTPDLSVFKIIYEK